MTTYGVTNDGFVIKPFSVIRSEVEIYQRENVPDGAGLSLIDRSTLGSINVSNINQQSELWELAQAVYSAMYPNSATGWPLDEVCDFTGTTRDQNTKTTVVGRVTMNPDKDLPIGSVANLTNRPDVRFLTTQYISADPAGGTFRCDFEAELAGATEVAIGQLSEIAEPVPGWTAVDNFVVGETGDAREEDDELRAKRDAELTAGGSTNVDAIRADLMGLEGVIDAVVRENDKGIVRDGLKPHSVRCILRGGGSTDISGQIYVSKAGGIDTNGAIQNNVTDSKGYDHTIEHDIATAKDIYVDIAYTTDDDWDPATGPDDVKTAILAYINALGIDVDVLYDRVRNAPYSVTGLYEVTTLYIGFADDPTGTSNLSIDDSEFAESDAGKITVL